MKIGIDLRFLSNPDFLQRGVGRYILALLQQMLVLRPQFKFVLLPSTDQLKHILPGEIITNPGVSILEPYPVYSRSKLGLLKQLAWMPFSFPTRAANIWHFPFSEIAPVALSRPFLLTVHDIYRDEQTTFNEFLYQMVHQGAIRGAAHVVTVSKHTQRDLIAYCSRAREKSKTIHSGVDRRIFSPESTNLAWQWAMGEYQIPAPYFLYVGGFDSRKGVRELLDVFWQLKQEHHLPHKLVLAGRLVRDCYPLFQRVAALKLYHDIVFLDYVPDPALRHLYCGADAFIFPSSFEGFGLPILEALACHTPVIAFNNTSIPEVVGNTVALVPTGNWNEFKQKILNTISSTSRSSILDVEKIEMHLSQFSWAHAAEQTLSLYEQCFRD